MRFPHAGGFEMADAQFVSHWASWFAGSGSPGLLEADGPVPRLAQAATLEALVDAGRGHGLDALCRQLVPTQYRNTMQATPVFVEANRHLLEPATSANPRSGREVEGVRLTRAGLQMLDGGATSRATGVASRSLPESPKKSGLPRSHAALRHWMSLELPADTQPRVEGDSIKVEFSFLADGHYRLDCLLMADEGGMITVTGSAYLAIPKSKESEILQYCTERASDYGVFAVVDGSLVYIHSRPVEAEPGDWELISILVARMDQAVSAVAEGVLEILAAR